jgi:hypothetical protein
MKPRAWAIVEVTMEVQIGPWGTECTVEKLVERGAREAEQHLRRMAQKDNKLRVVEAKAVRVTCRTEAGGTDD